MNIQSRLILMSLLLCSCLPAFAAELTLVYPKIYDKRTSYYDSLASQIRSDIGLNAKVSESPQVPDGETLVALGGTELYLHGYQGRRVDDTTQFQRLKKQFPAISTVKALYLEKEQPQLEQFKQAIAGPGIQVIAQAQLRGNAFDKQLEALLESAGDAKVAIWLPKSALHQAEQSVFRKLLDIAWQKQQVLISSTGPNKAEGFVFILLTNNQQFSQVLSSSIKKVSQDTFVMIPPKKAQTLSVIYPKVKAPHNLVFDQIIEGISKQFDGSVNLVSVDSDDDFGAIAATIDRDKPDMVITLSSRGMAVGQLLKVKTPWVAGATQLVPDKNYTLSGISPGGAPSALLKHLKELAPEISRLNVVYSDSSRWLVRLAETVSVSFGINVVAHEVSSRKEAIIKYTELFKTADHHKDAFWLPYDSITASSKYILPLVLDASWDKRFVVVSSIPPHAKRGALLSLYPDNTSTGSELVKMVETMFTESTAVGLRPTKKVLLAVNLRTASHLGLEYSAKERDQFDFTFPSR